MLGRVRIAATAITPALWVLAVIGFISQMGIAVMLPLLPLYATELGAEPFVLGLLTSAFAITNGIGQLGTGFLADRWGARRFITGGFGAYAAMNALIATAASAGWLLLWRSLAGFGGGALIVAERIYITEVTPAERRAFANGVISAAHSAGMVAGPAFGGLVAAMADLRAPFLIVAATSVVALATTRFLPRGRPHGASEAGTDAADAPSAPLPYASLAALMVANMAMMAGYGGFITTYAPLATARLGWSTLDVGIAFSFFGAGSILIGPWLAHLADRIGRRRVATLAPLPVATFGLALFAGLPQSAILAVAFITGGALTAFTASWYALLADVSDQRRRGRIFGVVSALSNTGIVIGATVAAQAWERVDVGAGMLTSSMAMGLAAAAMLAFRLPHRSVEEAAVVRPAAAPDAAPD
jgi:MFS family permease